MGAVLSRASSMVASAIGDPDVTFGYSTVQKVTIRDKRLGLLYYFFVFVILLYVFVYQVGFQQVYRKEGGIVGTARMQLQQPTVQFRTPAPAFCLGVNASIVTNGAGYTFPLPGYYAYQGSVPMEQGVCQYLDARFAIADPLENGALLLPTRTTLTQEVATPLPQCAASGQYDCGWATVSEQLTFIPDAEWFTLLIDHSFSALLGSLSRSSSEMVGSLVDAEGNKIDPCASYTSRGRPCPSFITVGVDGKTDIVSVQTLLDAVGISSLDLIGGSIGGVANNTLRDSGLVLLLSISYSNYYLPATFGGGTLLGTGSFNASRADYSYRVSIVPNSEFKAEYSQPLNGSIVPSPARLTYNRHGIRIVVSQTGRIGVFDIQIFLVNMVVALGLIVLANTIVDFIAIYLCPLRALYSQYAQRVTVSLSDILDVLPPHKINEMLREFREDEHLVDPVPPGILKWQAVAAEIATERASLAAAFKPGASQASDRRLRVKQAASPPAEAAAASAGSGGSDAPADGGEAAGARLLPPTPTAVGAAGGLAAKTDAPKVVGTRNPLSALTAAAPGPALLPPPPVGGAGAR